ncbi:hypothetical protein QBC35DRAFT_520730 [Podospora australis]|uniref:Nicotinamide N-methyltransferase n=1 Tax=Podospora australis TaxID=1536484 RepID=A0AAN6X1W4_9PEZI|nr:hypothetical protein QBC35DRAFT_520730 [Podospora australis]
MALTARLALTGPDTSEPEDFLASSLGVIFPDDPLQFALAEVKAEEDRHLFSHYLWNSSLMLAELIEAGTLGLTIPHNPTIAPPISDFDVSGLSSIELGAGTALPSIMSGLLGARRVVVTDYPAPPGHGWGESDTPLAQANEHAFDRVFVADCLWMPWQHGNLRKSISWFLGEGEGARAWVELLAEVGLEVEKIWERDCDGEDREWVWDRGIEDISVRKRWLAVASLKRIGKSEVPNGSEGKSP